MTTKPDPNTADQSALGLVRFIGKLCLLVGAGGYIALLCRLSTQIEFIRESVAFGTSRIAFIQLTAATTLMFAPILLIVGAYRLVRGLPAARILLFLWATTMTVATLSSLLVAWSALQSIFGTSAMLGLCTQCVMAVLVLPVALLALIIDSTIAETIKTKRARGFEVGRGDAESVIGELSTLETLIPAAIEIRSTQSFAGCALRRLAWLGLAIAVVATLQIVLAKPGSASSAFAGFASLEAATETVSALRPWCQVLLGIPALLMLCRVRLARVILLGWAVVTLASAGTEAALWAISRSQNLGLPSLPALWLAANFWSMSFETMTTYAFLPIVVIWLVRSDSRPLIHSTSSPMIPPDANAAA